MKKFYCLLFLTVILISSNLEAELLSTQDKDLFDQLLESNDLPANSVNYLKDWAADTKFKLPVVVDVINNPFRFPEISEDLQQKLQRESILDFMALTSELLFQMEFSDVDQFEENIRKELQAIRSPNGVFGFVKNVWRTTDKIFDQAFDDLSPEDKDKLEYFAYSLHAEPADSLIYNQFYTQNKLKQFADLESEEIISLVGKIDFIAIMQAAYLQQIAFDQFSRFVEKQNWQIDKPIIYDSLFGKMIIGTNQTDYYAEDYTFILDLGGDDLYSSRIATDFQDPFYWVIDLNGNDLYRSQFPAGLMSVNFGLGYSYDADGHDIYQAGDLSFSSFFGYNYHYDFCGDDSYNLGLHSAGAGSFGLSILKNGLGNDTYRVTQLGEGFGGTLGLGVLYDSEGSDLYYAGGKYLHEPLAPYDYRSLGQGFGYGLRPDMAGGIGMLVDDAGNDRYDGGVYAQGVGYWYALGILLDQTGNDFYNAVYYPQGSGIHLAGGLLYDGSGEDSYYSKHGPGQGAGHDYGVGFLIDGKGDDAYSVEGGNGLGIANGVGIFLDGSGNDRYERAGPDNYGVGKLARNSGSLGLFIDKGGYDTYADSLCADEGSWRQNKYGFGSDLVLSNPLRTVQQDSEKRAAEVDSLVTIDEIFALAAGWGVGNNKDTVAKAAEILLQRDAETAAYIAENQMTTQSGLTWRAISNYAKKSQEFPEYFPELLESSDSLIVKNSIALVSLTEQNQYISELEIFLKAGKYITSILSALGNFDEPKSIEILSDYCNDESEKIRVITARSLRKISSPASLELLEKMKDDKSFLIRSLYKNLD